MTDSLVLIGGGGHAKVVFDAAISAGLHVAGFLDDDPDAVLRTLGVERLGSIRDWASCDEHATFVPAIGDNATRFAVMRGLCEGGSPHRLSSVVHDAAIVSCHDVQIGSGAFIGPGAIVNPGARIGVGAIINSGAIIEHDVVIGDWAHVGPGAVLGGAATVEAQVLIGLGSRVLPGIGVGSGAVVGTGAVVTKRVPAHTTVRGVPARES